jgi:hypothetical protein
MALPIFTPAAHDAVASRESDMIDCTDISAQKPEATNR